MELWFSLTMIAETTGLVLGGRLRYLKWTSGGWLFHYLGGSVGSSQWSELNWLIFILRMGGRKLLPRMIHESALCPILPHNLQIIFCITCRAAMTVFRVNVLLFVEYDLLKGRELWAEEIPVFWTMILLLWCTHISSKDITSAPSLSTPNNANVILIPQSIGEEFEDVNIWLFVSEWKSNGLWSGRIYFHRFRGKPTDYFNIEKLKIHPKHEPKRNYWYMNVGTYWNFSYPSQEKYKKGLFQVRYINWHTLN